jgi:branched-chain amino acid transport system permease protein
VLDSKTVSSLGEASIDHAGLERALEIVRGAWQVVALTALLAGIVLLIGAVGSVELQQVAIQMLINLIIVVGLYVFIGNSGVLSFGHISFMSIGAYASALVTIPVITKSILLPDLPGFLARADLSSVPAALVAGGAAMVFAAVAGIPIVRLAGIPAAIATFSVLVIVQVVISNWTSLTRGEQTMTGVPLTTTIDNSLLWAIVAIGIAFAYKESKAAFRLRASREDELGARALGIRIGRERWIAFVISAFLVGVAGHLYGHMLGSFSPDDFYVDVTFTTLAMLIVGGRLSLAGAILGTLVISTVLEVGRRFENGIHAGPAFLKIPGGSSEVAFAVLTLAILIVRRDGIIGRRFD